MQKHYIETLISSEDVNSRIAELGTEITKFYKNIDSSNLVVIGLLRGSVLFMADLIRKIDLPLEIDFITASSYGNDINSSMEVKILKDLDGDISGKHVLIVEDIVDTGFTLSKILSILKLRDPKSVNICTLLDKPSRREIEVPIQWIGFSIPNEFVIGCGLDYAQLYRNLDFIGKVVFTNE